MLGNAKAEGSRGNHHRPVHAMHTLDEKQTCSILFGILVQNVIHGWDSIDALLRSCIWWEACACSIVHSYPGLCSTCASAEAKTLAEELAMVL